MRRIILKGVNPNHFPEITPVSDDMIGVVLAPGNVHTILVPDDARYVIFNADADFYAAYDNLPVIPDDLPGHGPTKTEYNPGQRFIGDKKEISIVSKYAMHLQLSFFA